MLTTISKARNNGGQPKDDRVDLSEAILPESIVYALDMKSLRTDVKICVLGGGVPL